jgi:hypothetical protein
MIFTLLNPSRKEKTLKEERKRNGEKLKTMEILLYTERERREIVEVDERGTSPFNFSSFPFMVFTSHL